MRLQRSTLPALPSEALERRPRIEKRRVVIFGISATTVVIAGDPVQFVEVREAEADTCIEPRPRGRTAMAPRHVADIDDLAARIR